MVDLFRAPVSCARAAAIVAVFCAGKSRWPLLSFNYVAERALAFRWRRDLKNAAAVI
jgi:hypothetical protein